MTKLVLVEILRGKLCIIENASKSFNILVCVLVGRWSGTGDHTLEDSLSMLEAVWAMLGRARAQQKLSGSWGPR